MIVKLLNEHHLEFQSLNGGCRGLTESTHVKMPYCWKSHATDYIIPYLFRKLVKMLQNLLSAAGVIGALRVNAPVKTCEMDDVHIFHT